jgi:hypothetical protein
MIGIDAYFENAIMKACKLDSVWRGTVKRNDGGL